MKRTTRTMMTLLGLTFVFIVAANLLGFFSKTPATYPAVFDTIEYQHETKGYLFFKEYFISSPVDGTVEYLYQDGARVGARTPIAVITKRTGEDSKQAAKPLDTQGLLIDRTKVEKKISSLEDEVSFYYKENRTKDVERLQSEISYLYAVLNQLPASESINVAVPVNTSRTFINSEGKVENNKYSVYSEKAGVLSQHISKYDPVFSMDNTFILNYSKIPQLEMEPVKTQVKKGDVFLRLIDNKAAYLVFTVEKDQLQNYINVGRFETKINGIPVETVVHQIFYADEKYGIMLQVLQDFQDMQKMREVNLQVTPVKAYGLVIEDSSVIEEKGKVGVKVVRRSSREDFVPIKILSSVGGKSVIAHDNFSYVDDEGNVISVDTVSIYDDIVKEPRSD